MTDPGADSSDAGATRREIRERLARGLYQLERSRDRTDPDRQARWEQLNQGRRATRLAHADELLSALIGAFGFDWTTAEAIDACADAARAAGGDRTVAAEAARAAEILKALLPKRVGG
ncbi:MAG TPA: hypothetical protein VK858_13285 [Longimicrobiales bacterium]|nr:hypothetical protein [Longimicrobiales bacterium]